MFLASCLHFVAAPMVDPLLCRYLEVCDSPLELATILTMEARSDVIEVQGRPDDDPRGHREVGDLMPLQAFGIGEGVTVKIVVIDAVIKMSNPR